MASSVLFGAMIWTIRSEGYSLLSLVPSELTAIGAPTQTMWMWLGSIQAVVNAQRKMTPLRRSVDV